MPLARRAFRRAFTISLVISTHTLSPRIFVDFIRQDIEVDVYFVGIQPAQTHLGEPLSPKVNQAVQSLTQTLIKVFPPPYSTP